LRCVVVACAVAVGVAVLAPIPSAGLKLNAKTGVISGSPNKKAAGAYNITVQLLDSKKPRPRFATTKTFALTVDICRPGLNPKVRC
jgi:hypothetical protein